MKGWQLFKVSGKDTGTRFGTRLRVILKLRYDAKTAWGEIAPLPGYSAESAVQAAQRLSGFLRQHPDVASGREGLPQLARQSPAAAFALEAALDGLREKDPALGKQVMISWLWQGGQIPDGVRCLKIKYHGSRDALVQQLDRLRNELGFVGNVRLDANGRWTSAQEAAPFLQGLESWGVQGIEQPLSVAPGAEWHELAQRFGFVYWIDEGLAHFPLSLWLDNDWVGGFVLKGMHVGDRGTLLQQVRHIESWKRSWILGSLLPGAVGRRHECRQAVLTGCSLWGTGAAQYTASEEDGLVIRDGQMRMDKPLQVDEAGWQLFAGAGM